MRLSVGYPDEARERRIATRYRASADPLGAVDPVADAAGLLSMRDAVRGVAVAASVEEYVVKGLVRATRQLPELRLGASPRAAVALYRATQAWAYLQGRSFALPDDVKAVARAVLGHRLLIDIDRQLRGLSPEEVVDGLLDAVEVPLVEEGSSAPGAASAT